MVRWPSVLTSASAVIWANAVSRFRSSGVYAPASLRPSTRRPSKAAFVDQAVGRLAAEK